MKKNHVTIIICISLLLLPLSACFESSFPTGTFVANSGFYRFMLTDNGSFTFSEGGQVEARGTYSIHANEFTFATDSYCDGRGAGKATYTWTFKNDTLLFTIKGKDKCYDRFGTIYLIPYQKEQQHIDKSSIIPRGEKTRILSNFSGEKDIAKSEDFRQAGSGG